MSQIAQQVVVPTFTDPNNIEETFVNGPFSLNINNGIATFTFTAIRGDLDQSMKGTQVTKYEAAVACRLAMPLGMAVEMKALLSKSIQEQPIAAGSQLTQ